MPFTITTWNVQNFTRSEDNYAAKLDLLADMLETLGSDVVALQEILDEDALEDLAGRLGFEHYAAAPDGRNNRVAFLTRNAPVQDPQQIDQWRLAPGVQVHRFNNAGEVEIVEQFRRPALRMTVMHGDDEIDIITTHMKSKLLTFGGNFSTTDETLRAGTAQFALECRTAEAVTLREHMTDLLAAGRRPILLGDFNDGPEAATTQILYGPPGSQPRDPDDAMRTNGAFQLEDSHDERRMFNVTKIVPPETCWTRRHNSQNELLDHILASEELMPRDGNNLRRIPAVSISNSDTPNMIGDHPTAGDVMPDHAPVTATFV